MKLSSDTSEMKESFKWEKNSGANLSFAKLKTLSSTFNGVIWLCSYVADTRGQIGIGFMIFFSFSTVFSPKKHTFT